MPDTVIAQPLPGKPSGGWAMRMTWENLLFMHWPIEASALRSLVPTGLEIDTFQGKAWVGLIPFLMSGVRMARTPRMPTTHRFPECNVRTYVHPAGRPDMTGVWFFSLDAASRVAVHMARTFWRLNYLYGKLSIARDGDTVRYSVERLDTPRAAMKCAWRIGEQLPASKPGELAHFLTERYRLFSVNRRGDICEGRIWHEPWPLREAALIELDDGLVRAAGIDVDTTQPPICWHADRVDVEAWKIHPVR